MALSPKQRSFLRGQAHKLSPVVMIGKEGLTESVLKAVYHALRAHELIKIKVPADDQESFQQMVQDILDQCEAAEKVQTIGHLLVLFRPSTPAGKVSLAMKAAKLPYSKANKAIAGSSSEEE